MSQKLKVMTQKLKVMTLILEDMTLILIELPIEPLPIEPKGKTVILIGKNVG
ncbi:MAG: hypothetical protein ACTSUE_20405 [Promethearchaeota archaeon]